MDKKAQWLRGQFLPTKVSLQGGQIVGRAGDETGAQPPESFSLECHAARVEAARTARRSLASSIGSKGLVMTPAAPRPMSLPGAVSPTATCLQVGAGSGLGGLVIRPG